MEGVYTNIFASHMNRFIFVLVIISSCMNTPPEEEVIVIGGGLMGSATAWKLGEAGTSVLLLEQQDSVYSYGSSFGEARISRSLGAKHDIFAWLQQTSVAETISLIAYLNTHAGGGHSMEDIYHTSPVTYLYHAAQQREIDNILYQQADTFNYAAGSTEARDMFGMNVTEEARVIREYKKYSGTLNPGVLIGKLHEAVRTSGNRVEYGQKVTALTKKDDHYEVQVLDQHSGETRILRSRKVVAAAGPYNGMLTREVAPYFESLISPKRLFLSFMQINKADYEKLSDSERSRLEESLPAAFLDDEIFYTMIENFDENGVPLIKAGGHMLRTDIADLDSIWQKELTEEEINWSRRRLAEYLRMLDIPVEAGRLEFRSGYSCVYSLTGSEIPYVTPRIDDSGNIDTSFLLVGGMSGIGAKGTLAYGLIAADLLLGRENNSPMYRKTAQAMGSGRLQEDIEMLRSDLGPQ